MNNNDKLAKLAMNKSLLKEFHNNENDRIVYLKDGDEFQIQIFNPYQYVIGVSFTFNSDNVDNSRLLVLKPGERVWLDRYLNENKKLKFSTYNVNNSNDVKKAIEKNGIVNMYFYKEKEKNDNIYIYSPLVKSWEPNTVFYNYEITCDNNTKNYCDTKLRAASLGISSLTGSMDSSCSSASTYTSYSDSIDNTRSLLDTRSYKSKSIETGRIDKGSYSNQNFTNYYGDFDSWYFKKETIKILPESQKQISSNDLSKKYCHNCGKKIKVDFKFCPNCGAKQ